jgi:hypothetical protein
MYAVCTYFSLFLIFSEHQETAQNAIQVTRDFRNNGCIQVNSVTLMDNNTMSMYIV